MIFAFVNSLKEENFVTYLCKLMKFKSIDHICLGLFLDSEFYSVGPYVYAYTNTTLF